MRLNYYKPGEEFLFTTSERIIAEAEATFNDSALPNFGIVIL